MGKVEWELKNGSWLCYVDDALAFQVPEREMNETASEKGGLGPAQAYYERQYLEPA